ncbi:hypothetical protein AB3X52_18150 [Nocardioides sp. DS6]|uniref:O-antigen ligase domain-containing protein n=1 Tax=Nocardioides eburneus TaxID=3231482 RepID=A0ABV3T4D9_9ACTN
MSTLVPARRPADVSRWLLDRVLPRTAAGGVRAKRLPLFVVLAWGMLVLNVLPFLGATTVLPIPRTAAQVVNQGALLAALGFALLANHRGLLRSSFFLVLVSLLPIAGLAAGFHATYVTGAVFRAARFATFVAVLWLLSPWFGRRDLTILRSHLAVLRILVGSVVLGLAVAPGTARSFDGRLAGVIWPIPATQVGHYAAVLLGVTVIGWACRLVPTRGALLTVLVAAPVLLLSHTRTALLALLVALLVAGATLFLSQARVRRVSATGALVGLLAATVFASQVTHWLLRGQTTQNVGQLTGRTKVWDMVFAQQRSLGHDLFGSGMSNMSFNGLPIDSNWVATYLDGGWFGLMVEAAFLLVLLLMVAVRVRGPQRAIGAFLVVYVLISSITETGLSAPSSYLLDLVVAAALLSSAPRTGGAS